jgi:large subunit ribosomal protein L19
MGNLLKQVADSYKKAEVVDVRSGDTVKVHQKIKEGGKERIQIFQGMVINTANKDSLTNRITVRRIASGVGVEKSFLLHSPNVTKVEVVKRTKVRRNYLTYMRERTGKSARLSSVDFDKKAVNEIRDEAAEKAEAAAKEALAKKHAEEEAKKAEEDKKEKAKLDAAMANREKDSSTEKE